VSTNAVEKSLLAAHDLGTDDIVDIEASVPRLPHEAS